MYWVAVIIIVLLLFWMMNRSEGFDTVPATGYAVCGTDGARCLMKDPGASVYYGVPPDQMTQITPNNMKFDKSGLFTCLPSGFSPVSESPVLPISDPLPNQKKTCMTRQFTKCNGVGGSCNVASVHDTNLAGTTNIDFNGQIYYGAEGGLLAPAGYSFTSSLKNNNTSADYSINTRFDCTADKFEKKLNEWATHGYHLHDGPKSCYQVSQEPTMWTQ